MPVLRTPVTDLKANGAPLVPPPKPAAEPNGSAVAEIDRGVQSLSGWGRFPIEDCRLYEARGEADLPGLLASRRNPSYIARGLGRSYGDAALNRDAAAVSLLGLRRILSLDRVSGILDCEAGVSLDEIIRYALPRGFFLPVTPGTRFVTVGGAIAADVHGKNHHRAGSFSNFVAGLELLAPTGERVVCSAEHAPQIFWATVGGMGLTGFITRARIRLRAVESAYVVVRFEKADNLAQALELLAEGDRQCEYSVAWVDCIAGGPKLGRSVVMLGRHATATEIPKHVLDPLVLPPRTALNVPFVLPVTPLRPWTVHAFNALYFASKPQASEQLVDLDRFFYPLDSVGNWNRLYGRRGFVQYQIVVPHADAPSLLAEIFHRVRDSGRAAFLGVLKRFGDRGSGMLSFPMPGATLALDMAVDKHLPAFLQELDALVIGCGGRIYLAKDATLSPANLARSYPRLEEFLAVKHQLDPRSLISSSLARRLKIADA